MYNLVEFKSCFPHHETLEKSRVSSFLEPLIRQPHANRLTEPRWMPACGWRFLFSWFRLSCLYRVRRDLERRSCLKCPSDLNWGKSPLFHGVYGIVFLPNYICFMVLFISHFYFSNPLCQGIVWSSVKKACGKFEWLDFSLRAVSYRVRYCTVVPPEIPKS